MAITTKAFADRLFPGEAVRDSQGFTRIVKSIVNLRRTHITFLDGETVNLPRKQIVTIVDRTVGRLS